MADDTNDEKAFFVPLTFLGFTTSLGEGTDDERDEISAIIGELRKSKEFQEKLFEISTFVSEKFNINFLMVPRFIEVSSQESHKDIISKFIAYLGGTSEDDGVTEIPFYSTNAETLIPRVD